MEVLDDRRGAVRASVAARPVRVVAAVAAHGTVIADDVAEGGKVSPEPPTSAGDDAADERDVTSSGRDDAGASGAIAALARDDAAEARDVASSRRRLGEAAGQRTHAADDRAAAAIDRAESATDRQVATDQLRDAAQALAAIVNSSQDAVIAKTVEGIITAWNSGATFVYGRTAEEMLGHSVEAMIPADALVDERARLGRVAEGFAESGYRCVRLRGDGQRLDVVMSMSPIRGQSGSITGVASISRLASTAERDNARFASLLEAAPDAIVCVDGQGTIVTVNAQVTNMFGYSREELLGAELEVLLPEKARGRHQALRSAFLRDPRIRSMGVGLALSGRRRDGSVFPIEVSLAPDRSGSDPMVIAAVRDVSAKHELEREARETETRLRQLAESVDIVFILRQLDPPAYLYVSAGSHTVLGLEPRELMASNELAFSLVHPDDRVRVMRDFVPALLAGARAASEMRIARPDGQVRWVRWTSTPVPNPNGHPQRTVVTIEDITERIETAEALLAAEAAAREANQSKNQFLSRMSHELRTPLNAVLGFGQLLEMRLVDTDDAEAVRQILKGGRHLLDLINEVLDITKIDAGETSISREAVSVAGVVDETTQLMAPLARAAGVVLMGAAQSADCMVVADRQRLRQMLLNLLSNAVKYNRPGGKVWVEHRATDNRVAITVHDDGPGIRPELQSRLFTPFDRLGAEASGVDGTGIGLVLTRALAELMDGCLTVESVPGRGSRFTITLPQAQDFPGETVDFDDAHPAAAELGLSAGTCALLYIEDNEPNVSVVEHVLKLRPEWRLIHAALGSLGVELAKAHLPDLILLDLHLPDGSGTEVLRALKRDPATNALPIVILTADAVAAQSLRLLDLGADRSLTKPVDISDLLALLDEKASLAVTRRS